MNYRRLFWPGIVGALLLGGAFVSGAAETKRAPLKWFTLNGCQFMQEEYRDGDSFHVMTPDQRQFVFRLYFVDAPETDSSIKNRVSEQAQHFGVSEEEIIKSGATAKKFAAEWLKRGCNVTTRWQNAQGRGRLPRYYAQIDVGGRDLGELWMGAGEGNRCYSTRRKARQRSHGEVAEA